MTAPAWTWIATVMAASLSLFLRVRQANFSEIGDKREVEDSAIFD